MMMMTIVMMMMQIRIVYGHDDDVMLLKNHRFHDIAKMYDYGDDFNES